MGEARLRIVRCPRCGGESVFSPENPFRPFCSERCKSADFGAWASEHYVVPERPADDELSAPPAVPPRH